MESGFCSKGHGGIESISKASHLPLAWGGARDGEEIFEHRSAPITQGRAWRANRSESADHRNRRRVGKSARRLLEVRKTVGGDLEARVPAVDESRATKTARLDRIAYSRRSHGATPALADFRSRYAAPAGGQRSHGSGLVYETHACGSAACTGRRGTEVD